MHIVHLTTVHPPFDTRIFHKQAKTLVEAGYDVTLIAQHNKDETVDGVKIIALPKPKNHFARIFGLTRLAFRLALRQKADVYHFHDPELLPVGAFLKMWRRTSVVYDVHENVPKQILNKPWLPIWARRWVAMVYKIIERICLPFVDTIVIAEDSYIENYPDHRNVVSIRNYPLTSFVSMITPNTAKWSRNTLQEFRLVYVGGVSKLRGAMELIEAVKILKEKGFKEIVLSLIGPIIPPHLKDILLYKICQDSLKDSVHIPGPVPHEEVYNILAHSHVGLAILHPDPNYVDSLPTKLFEYMIAGIPVIASNFPTWKEIVEGNKCGLSVDPLNPKEIAEAIIYFIKHPEEAQEMGQNGRRAVLEKYNWKQEGQKLIDLYRELLA